MDINHLTRTVIGCSFKIHNTLGAGFLEAVYRNALRNELVRSGIQVKQKQKILVWYEGDVVGKYEPDLWIPDKLIIEIKAVENLLKIHEVQLVNYLAATRIDNGLLINFGSSVEVRRKFLEYKPKAHLTSILRTL
jgi:GxxExxY protein